MARSDRLGRFLVLMWRRRYNGGVSRLGLIRYTRAGGIETGAGRRTKVTQQVTRADHLPESIGTTHI